MRLLEPLQLTEELVRIDTVSTKPCAPLVRRIMDELEPLDAQIQLVHKPGEHGQVNLVARIGPDVPGGLAFAGHMDTVPWDQGMRATTAPERDGRRLYGRGTCDMKGAIAAMVHAARASAGARLLKPLWLAFTFQEEIGCHGAKLLEDVIHLPAEHCIVGEPTGLRPVIAHKGYVIADLTFSGMPCHSSDPSSGASALHAAARSLDRLLAMGDRWAESPNPDTALRPPYTTVNVGLLSGGTARNVVPDSAKLTLEMRPLPGTSPESLFAAARAEVNAALATVPGVSVDFVETEADEPFSNSESAHLVNWLQERAGKEPGTVPFYTEAQILTRMGPSTCVFGPGEIAQAHRVDEFVEFDALDAAAEHYRAAIEEFCR